MANNSNTRRALVAASSKGLGYASANALVEHGYHVSICGRDRAALQAAQSHLGPRVTAAVVDLSDPEDAAAWVTSEIERHGGLEVLVTNSGGPPPGRPGEVALAQYEAAFRSNCVAAIAMIEAALPTMRSAEFGRVLSITSIAVRQPIPNLVLSNTARAGLTAYLKTLAREVAPHGITVNSLQPGYHLTDRLQAVGDLETLKASIPAGFIGNPDDFGAIVAFLASDAANYITGAHLPVDGGVYAGLQ